MELKSYQKIALHDLEEFLQAVEKTGDISKAYEDFLTIHKDLPAKPPYNNVIPGVPHVCFKVPTGGGKTFMAAASLGIIFNHLPMEHYRFVVWLVPSEAILEQTVKNLSNPQHPYNQRLRTDFAGRVSVFTKQQMLNGMQFSPESVRDQLNICVLSYDSFRSSKKEGRKAYQENGNLSAFQQFYSEEVGHLDNTDDTSLMQTIRQFKPVIIVDESHHATSSLSLDMLRDFYGSFILDLTATPRNKSNIISYVSAASLKKENMVKLPVVVYNVQRREDVISRALDTRNRLEAIAKQENYQGSVPVRPIVLFQAEPKNKGKEEAATFDRIKQELVDGYNIPAAEIAIKTATINELKGVDLMAADCRIRYIITVNALKEGWDCPFAYILASLANKTSDVDVEQILGRVLRQPYTRQFSNKPLNMSYVYTSSAKFKETLENIVAGLNAAGFTENDYRAKEIFFAANVEMDNLFALSVEATGLGVVQPTSDATITFPRTTDSQSIDDEYTAKTRFVYNTNQNTATELNVQGESIPNTAKINYKEEGIDVGDDLAHAGQMADDYANQNMASSGRTAEEERMMNHFTVKEEFASSVDELRIPQFFIHESNYGGLFGTEEQDVLLKKEHLWKDFKLNNKDTDIDLSHFDAELFKIDVNDDNVPQYMKGNAADMIFFEDVFSKKNFAEKVKMAVNTLVPGIDKKNQCISASDIKEYLTRMLTSWDEQQLDDLMKHINAYTNKINDKITDLLKNHAAHNFRKLLDSKKIKCYPSYALPREINPPKANKNIPKSLYEAEDSELNALEHDVIVSVASLDNIAWWHRNRERKEFVINGYINHYPDFLLMTKKGEFIALETKGDDRTNDDSRRKIELGKLWADKAPDGKCSYFMVFKHAPMEGAYSIDEFMEIVKEM